MIEVGLINPEAMTKMATVQDSQCAIWSQFAAKKWQESILEDKTFYDSPRAGGRYAITEDAEENLRYMDDGIETLRIKARLTTWLVETREQGHEWPFVTTNVIAEVKCGPSLSITDRANRLLMFLACVSPNLGTRYSLSGDESLLAMALSESTDFNEVVELTEFLTREGLVNSTERPWGDRIIFKLTAEGLAYTERPDQEPSRRIGFDLPHQT